jgi:putative hemolysin
MPAFIILALVLVSGIFSLFHQALQAVRLPRLKKESADAANQGRSGTAKRYRRVIEAAQNPGNYYAVSRLWICALRTLAVALGVVGVERQPLPIALWGAALVTGFLLLGDLVPGIIARSQPERIAVGLFPLLWMLVQPLRPLFFLAQAIGGKMRLALYSKTGRTGITEDELRQVLIEGEESGIVESKERTMVEGVFYLGDRPLGVFMTHRSEIQWLDINATAQEIRTKVLEYRAQRCFPVADGTLDAIIGAAYLEDVILDIASELPAGLRAVMKKALFAPETMPALKAFELFKRGDANFLFVMDEYGGFAGMVSVRALVEEIVGELAEPAREEEQAVPQEDGSWIAGGALSIDDAAAMLSLPEMTSGGDYHTLAGFVLSLAGELPSAGDSFVYQGYRFTVLDMDGNRIGRIGVKKE